MGVLRSDVQDLIRRAVLTERERGACYLWLSRLTDREVTDELYPKIAQVFEDEAAAARVLRTELLKGRS
jgi:hypothetical protein